MISVYSGRACLGFIITRGREGFEAYDQQERSLGFSATAVMRSQSGIDDSRYDAGTVFITYVPDAPFQILGRRHNGELFIASSFEVGSDAPSLDDACREFERKRRRDCRRRRGRRTHRG